MQTPITIDLRTDLTDEVVAAALPHIGACLYSAPCIIGAMIPEDMRASLDHPSDGNTAITCHTARGRVRFLSGQQTRKAKRLQQAFDCDGDEEFLRVLAKVRAELAQQVSA